MGALSQAVEDDFWAIVLGIIIGWHMSVASASSVEQLQDIVMIVLVGMVILHLVTWLISRYRGDDSE